MSSTHAIARSAAWATFEAAGSVGLQIVSLVVLARLLGPAEFGTAALAIAIIYTLNLFVQDFFEKAIVQRAQLDEAHVSSAFWASAASAILLGGLTVVWAGPLAAALGVPATAHLLRALAPALVLGALNGVTTAVLRREMRFRDIALATLVGRVSSATVAIAMACLGYGVWSFVGQQLAVFGATSLALLSLAGWRPRARFSWRHLRELGGFAVPSVLCEILTLGDVQIFYLLSGHLFGPIALGYFSVATRAAGSLGNIIDTVARQLNLSIFARRQHERAALRDAMVGSTAFTCLLAVPLFVGLAACAEETVAVAFGPQWAAAVPLIQLLAVARLFVILLGPIRTAVDAVGRPGWHLLRGTTELLVDVAGLLALAPLGVLATGIVTLVKVVVSAPIDVVVTNRFVRISLAELAASVRWPLLAAGAMAALVAVARATVLAPWPAAPRLIGLVVGGGVLYVGGLWAVAPALVRGAVTAARTLMPAPHQAPPLETGTVAAASVSDRG